MNKHLEKVKDKAYMDSLSSMVNVKQTYHLEPEHGLLNDPVGLIYFKGKYHIFFQWNSHAKDHSSKEWGHFSSSDLLHWTWHASPIQPGCEYDLNGVYSGSSMEWDGKIYAYYTGNRKKDGVRFTRQCLAVSEDGIYFKKEGPILEKPDSVTDHFRDPNVKIRNGKPEMIIGGQNLEKQGVILTYQSEDGKKWQDTGLYAISKNTSMIECPDLVHFQSCDLLLYGLQNRDPESDECLDSFGVYKLIDPKDPAKPIDLDKDWKSLDAGYDCYAAQTLTDSSGRILVYAWMNRLDDGQEKRLANAAQNIHCLTLPRELSIRDGKLYQKPARELYSLFELCPQPSSTPSSFDSRCWRADLSIDNQEFNLKINDRETQISWCPKAQVFTLFRWDWDKEKWQERSIHLETLNKVELFMDTSSLEVFINDGQYVFSARVLPTANDTKIFSTGIQPDMLHLYPAIPGSFTLEKIFQETFRNLNSIGLNREAYPIQNGI